MDLRDSSTKSPVVESFLAVSNDPGSIDLPQFRQAHLASLEERETYWRLEAERLTWQVPFSGCVDEDFDRGHVAWFEDGRLAPAWNAVDRWVAAGEGHRPALYVAAEDGNVEARSYDELAARTRSCALRLRERGLEVGDRVVVDLPDSEELVILLLALARAGLVAVPLPCAFPDSLVAAIATDCGAKLTVTAEHPDLAVLLAVSEGEGDAVGAEDARGAEDPLYILYARSAGRPRGAVFATGGFLVQASATYRALCLGGQADIALDASLGLVSEEGLSLGLWGALLWGRCLSLGDGARIPSPPREGSAGLVWLTSPPRLAERLAVTDGPLGVTTIACSGEVFTPRLAREAALRLAGPEQVLNLWSQTEAGGALLFTRPGAALNRPGAIGLPLLGVDPAVVNDLGEFCRANESGRLVFRSSWPGMIRGLFGQAERFRELYFAQQPGCFATQDGVRVDAEGFYWFMGRLDDVVKFGGISLATSEVETVLCAHEGVREVAVVGFASDARPELIAFVVREGGQGNEAALSNRLAESLGESARPTRFVFVDELPRTRTGKVVRRLLKRVARDDANARDDVGHVANVDSLRGLFADKSGGPDDGPGGRS